MIGGLAVVGLFLGLYFGLGYPDAIESDAAHGFLRCEHGYDLINGKCIGWGRHTGEVGYSLCGLYGMKEHKKWIILRFIRVTCC